MATCFWKCRDHTFGPPAERFCGLCTGEWGHQKRVYPPKRSFKSVGRVRLAGKRFGRQLRKSTTDKGAEVP